MIFGLLNPNTGAKYPPNTPLAPNVWYSAVIPLSALHAADTRVTRAGIESDRMGSVWFDDVMIASPIVMKWPLATSKASSYVTSPFGDDWNNTYCGGLIKKHNGTDYHAGAGTAVYAAQAGTVRQIFDSGSAGWAWSIVLEHVTPSGQPYTTVYWHVNPVPGLDGFIGPIAKGQNIGTVADLTPYGHATHFHFGLRIGAYNAAVFNGTNYAGTGGLPQNNCQKNTSSPWYPAFPAGFIDPNLTNNVLFQ